MSSSSLRVLFVLAALTGLPACDQLFPELVGPAPDMTLVPDGGDPGSLAGSVCVLADLRDPASCGGLSAGRRVTIEETRASADVGSDGRFSISLAGVVDHATIAIVDGATTTGQTTPTVTRLSTTTLATARGTGITLPCVPTGAMSNLFLQAGGYDDPTRGALLGWVLDASGLAVADVSAAPISGGLGPLYDGGTSGELDGGVATGPHGALAFLDLPPGDVALAVATPVGSPLAGDSFTLPIRGGAVTTAALALPPR